MLDNIVAAQQTQNRNHAERLALAVEFLHRCEQDREKKNGDTPPHFILTPLQETTAELGPLLGIAETTVEIQIDHTTKLQTWFPGIWARCLQGRLDIARAQIVLDAANALANKADIPKLAALIEEYLTKYDDPSAPLLTLTRTQFQRAVRYRALRFKQKSKEENFAEAFKRRRVSFRPDENGIGHLGVTHMVTELMAADHRLTLIAKKVRQNDETRNLEQIRADVLIDLILGRLEVTATNGELEEDDEQGGGRDAGEMIQRHPVGKFARPVINVTVPIQTLMGFSDEPALLSGGIPIPAEMAQIIALDKDSTWYRMLTDEARRCVELSTEAYSPSEPIFREVVATDGTCIYPGCSRPAVRCELDHRKKFPEGKTSTENLGPLCERHHKVKHSGGFDLRRLDDGSYLWITRAGSVFRTKPVEQPQGPWMRDDEPEGDRSAA
ncbi:MAG: HNH endonuclease signature motif containing protein [Nocardioidaceae bacterium]